MIIILVIVGAILALVVLAAFLDMYRLDVPFNQALAYAPFKLIRRISDKQIAAARTSPTPVIYAIWNQSTLDPALMLSLLPDQTLHILDERSAHSGWLEPWRNLARTIEFNAHHIFVSRRLVRVLKGNGRLAVYFPNDTAPDAKALRLYRAVSRIALQADASILPIYVSGEASNRGTFDRLTIKTLPPLKIPEITARQEGDGNTTAALLHERMMEVRR